MRDEKKIVLVTLEPSEEPGTPETISASASAAAAASLHTASRSRRSATRIGQPETEDARRADTRRAAAPAPSTVLVRFQFVVIDCRLLRFPAVVPLFPAVRGSVPGVRLSGLLVAALRSGPRQENRVLLSLRSGAVVARHAFAFDPARPSRLPPAHPVSRFGLETSGFRFRPPHPALRRSVQVRKPFGSAVRSSRFTTRARPPVPLVCCSTCSWSAFRSSCFGFVQACFRSFVSVSSRSLLRFGSFRFRFSVVFRSV